MDDWEFNANYQYLTKNSYEFMNVQNSRSHVSSDFLYIGVSLVLCLTVLLLIIIGLLFVIWSKHFRQAVIDVKSNTIVEEKVLHSECQQSKVCGGSGVQKLNSKVNFDCDKNGQIGKKYLRQVSTDFSFKDLLVTSTTNSCINPMLHFETSWDPSGHFNVNYDLNKVKDFDDFIGKNEKNETGKNMDGSIELSMKCKPYQDDASQMDSENTKSSDFKSCSTSPVSHNEHSSLEKKLSVSHKESKDESNPSKEQQSKDSGYVDNSAENLSNANTKDESQGSHGIVYLDNPNLQLDLNNILNNQGENDDHAEEVDNSEETQMKIVYNREEDMQEQKGVQLKFDEPLLMNDLNKMASKNRGTLSEISTYNVFCCHGYSTDCSYPIQCNTNSDKETKSKELEQNESILSSNTSEVSDDASIKSYSSTESDVEDCIEVNSRPKKLDHPSSFLSDQNYCQFESTFQELHQKEEFPDHLLRPKQDMYQDDEFPCHHTFELDSSLYMSLYSSHVDILSISTKNSSKFNTNDFSDCASLPKQKPLFRLENMFSKLRNGIFEKSKKKGNNAVKSRGSKRGNVKSVVLKAYCRRFFDRMNRYRKKRCMREILSSNNVNILDAETVRSEYKSKGTVLPFLGGASNTRFNGGIHHPSDTGPSGHSEDTSSSRRETESLASMLPSGSLSSYFLKLSEQQPLSPEEKMQYEWMRLQSFSHFPSNSGVSPLLLAKWGYYATGNGDEVVCYCCKHRYSNWKIGDNPRDIHKRHSPSCRFILGVDSGNAPIHGGSPANSLITSTQESRPSTTGENYMQNGTPSHISMATPQIPNSGSVNSQQPRTQLPTSRPSANASAFIQTPNAAISSGPSLPNGVVDSCHPVQISTASVENNISVPSNQLSSISLATSTPNNASSQQPRGIFAQATHSTPSLTGGISTPPVSTQSTNNTRSTPANGRDSTQQQSSLASANQDTLGINFDKPKYPSYAVLAVRISSYSGWPSFLSQTPREMSLAGFFYAGYGDYVRCFFCGGGLRNWESGDDPWVEHARWFPRCAFVRQNRGDAFVDLVMRRHQELVAEQNASGGQVDNAPQTTVEEDMTTPAALSLIEMGFSTDVVRAAITEFRERKPNVRVIAIELLEIVLELEERQKTTKQQQTPTSAPQQQASASASQGEESRKQTKSEPENQPKSAKKNKKKGKGPEKQQKSKGKDNKKLDEKEQASKQAEKRAPAVESANAYAPQRHDDLHSMRVNDTLDQMTLEEVKSLQEENAQLKEQTICKVCMDKNVSIAFLPCGHLACCEDCAPAMRTCPICREFVRGTVKTYLV